MGHSYQTLDCWHCWQETLSLWKNNICQGLNLIFFTMDVSNENTCKFLKLKVMMHEELLKCWYKCVKNVFDLLLLSPPPLCYNRRTKACTYGLAIVTFVVLIVVSELTGATLNWTWICNRVLVTALLWSFVPWETEWWLVLCFEQRRLFWGM